MRPREKSYGQGYSLSYVDRLGVWLSARKIRSVAPDFRGKVIADLGCGFEASFFRLVRDQVAHAYLLDVSLATDLISFGNTTCIEGDLLNGCSGIPDATVDLVLCVSVLEHLPDAQKALDQMHRILVPGGLCIINVPNWIGKRALEFSAFRMGLSPPDEMDDHKMYYGKRDLWPLLVRAGFRPSRIRMKYHKLGLNLFVVCSR